MQVHSYSISITNLNSPYKAAVIIINISVIYLYNMLPHTTETGDRLLPYGPHGTFQFEFWFVHFNTAIYSFQRKLAFDSIFLGKDKLN